MQRKGLTLIELAIGVAIIAVITGVSLISFSYLAPRRMESEARRIVSDLCWVRELAVARHLNYIVNFDVDKDVYIICEDRNNNGICTADEEIKRQSLEVDLTSVTPPSAELRFYFPTGATQSKTINLSHKGQTKQISVFGETGYVRIIQ